MENFRQDRWPLDQDLNPKVASGVFHTSIQEVPASFIFRMKSAADSKLL